MVPRISVLVLATFLILCRPASLAAQGFGEIMDSLSRPAPTPAGSGASLEEQVAWVKAQNAVATEALSPAALETMRQRVQAAGLPETRVEDFLGLAREVQRSATTAVDAMQAISAPPFPSPTPASVPTNEREAAAVRDSLQRAELAERSAGFEADLIRRIMEQQKALVAETEKDLRQSREDLASAKGDEARARATLEIELAEWKGRAAQLASFVAAWRLAQQEENLRRAGAEAGTLREALRAGGFDRQLSPSRADARLAALDGEMAEMGKQLAEAQRARDEALEARKSLPPDAAPVRALALEAALEAARGRVLSIEGSIRLADLERNHWILARRVASSPVASSLRDARGEAEETLRSLEEWRPLLERRLMEAKSAVAEVERQAAEVPAESQPGRALSRAVAAAKARVEALGALISRMDALVRLQMEFRTELGRDLEQTSAAEKVGVAWSELGRWAQGIWKFEVYHLGDASVTVGKIVMALLGVVLAFLLSRTAAVRIARAAPRRFRMDATQSAMLEKIIFFPTVALLLFTTLMWLNIPLGAFAFLGGALAIGVGFGAQNLMNNFISGLILLTERQIKPGDIIEVAGSTGRVTHLGSRCSRMRRFDGVEVLVPNSAFLEKEVVNWTLNDPHHRFDFTVGVAYGSPVERVMEILLAAVNSEADVLREPPPGVFFEAFGDSSLVFRVFYWLDVAGTSDARDVGSKIRCTIDQAFREAGIEMPFPQRDIHLRSAEPLHVKVEK